MKSVGQVLQAMKLCWTWTCP